MEEREKLIRDYYDAWLTKDGSDLQNYFNNNVIYSECYGPEYHGIEQIQHWFSDWNKQGNVLEWRIKQFIHHDNITVVEWFFKCRYLGKEDGFDGVSIIQFDSAGKIVDLKEFQSKVERIFPYR